MSADKRGKNVKQKKWIARVALLGAIMMISGCAHGVSEALIDNIDGLSIARGNAADHFGNGGFPGNGGQTGGGTTGGDNPAPAGTNEGGGTNGGGGVGGNGGGNGGGHPNSGGGNDSEGDPDVDPGKGNEHRSGKSKGKNQDQD